MCAEVSRPRRVPVAAPRGRLGIPLSSKFGTHKTVEAGFWPRLEPFLERMPLKSFSRVPFLRDCAAFQWLPLEAASVRTPQPNRHFRVPGFVLKVAGFRRAAVQIKAFENGVEIAFQWLPLEAASVYRCPASLAQTRQSRPDSGLDLSRFQYERL